MVQNPDSRRFDLVLVLSARLTKNRLVICEAPFCLKEGIKYLAEADSYALRTRIFFEGLRKEGHRHTIPTHRYSMCHLSPPPPPRARLVLAMSAWSVKIRRASSRHCRDARVYGHTTTAMHDTEYPASPPAARFFVSYFQQ